MRTVLRCSLLGAAAAAAALAPLAGAASAAQAATAPVPAIAPAAPGSVCPTGFTAGTSVTPPGGQQFVVCTGRIRSFDGTPLDTDVTIPAAAATGPRPLMMFFHGWGQDKTNWESTTLQGNNGDQYHWNNAWFASQGYAVLTWSARGFADSCGKDSSTNYIYSGDSTCNDTTGEESWTHLADRRWEIHDAQYLSGLLVDAGVADPQRIVASGGSYGGGQSWEMALSQDRVVASASTDPANPTTMPWTSPKGAPMHLVAAAPMYPWTDLADALVQNGTASDGFNGGPADGAQNGTHESPIGVEKESYVAGLYADGVRSAQYAAPNADPTADLTTWFAALNAGEPYESNPDAATALTQVGGAFRSPFAMPVPTGTHEVPVFVIQGQTDPLFNGFHAIDMINHLRATDPNYPVWAFLGDVGHAYAFNPQSVWQQAHTASNAWLAAVMAGTTPTNPRIAVTTTVCGVASSSAPYPAQTFTGDSYGSLATSVIHLGAATSTQGAAAQVTADPGGANQAPTAESKAADPIVSGGGAVGSPGCPTFTPSTTNPDDPNQAAFTWPAPSATLVGAPVVNVDVAVTGENASVAARLWDLDPASGTQTLVDRTVVRLTSATPSSAQHLSFELYPQAFTFPAGHQLRLELTQDDAATWRTDNQPSSLSFTNADLGLPVVTVPNVNLPEAPVAPLLPLGAALVATLAWRRRHVTLTRIAPRPHNAHRLNTYQEGGGVTMSRALRLAAATLLVAGGIATVGKATPVHAAGCQVVNPSTPSGQGTTCTPPDQLHLSANATRVAPQKTGTATANDPSTNTTMTWTFWEDVYSDPNNVYCSGCLTWIVKVTDTAASTDVIERVTISNFNGFSEDLGYLTDANGNPASEPSPPQGADTTSPALTPGSVIPDSAHSSGTGVLSWTFNNNINVGQSTVLLEVETNATHYVAGTVTAQDGVASNQPAYAPALPEFGIVPAFALIGGGAFGARVYRRRRRAAKTAA